MRAFLQRLYWFQKLGWPAVCIAAGALAPLALAPFDLWPAAILAIAIFFNLLYNATPKQLLWRSFWFAMGMFGVGTSWVLVSIWVFGQAPLPFAILLTLLFVTLLSSVFVLPFLLIPRLQLARPAFLLFVIPALWCIGEWLRTWLFTGFPWLFMGYAHLQTPLAGYAPIGGVLLVSLAVSFSGCYWGYLWLQRAALLQHKHTLVVATLALVAIWLGGWALNRIEWTTNYQQPVSVGIAQGNIPQEQKWDPAYVQPSFDRYLSLSESLWGNDWVIWPEAAIPLIKNYPDHNEILEARLSEIRGLALQHNSAFISGILYLSLPEAKFYNSIMATGTGAGIYHKRRLAPFGDYLPLRDWFGPVLDLFNLPHSILELGPENQRGLQVGGALIAPAICYEIAYPDLVAKSAAKAHAIITVSNDSWFGRSLGPLQHMQIAQMRALENRRYLVRSTNNGISAIVDDRGNILARAKQFSAESITAQIHLKQGATPFMRWGSEPVIGLAFFLVALAGFIGWRQRAKQR